jgi:ribosomal protein S18 acetylase RimI-like enzyme
MGSVQTRPVRIRPATRSDLVAIEGIVERAYGGYVERIGMRPGPMDADYADKLRKGLVSVVEAAGSGGGREGPISALLVLVEMPDHMLVENVAVDPARQGEGIGRALLAHAEKCARAAGLEEMRLYTHSKMTENRAFYRRLGYRETGRRDEAGFDRVFLVKRLG